MQTQQSHNGLGFFVALLLRMTDAARPPVILNAVKNPEPQTTQRSGLSTHDSLIPCTDCEPRLSECNRSSRSMAWDSSSPCSSEWHGRAPSCHSERSEESRASDHPALRSIDPGLSDSMYRLCISFVRVYTQQSRSGLGFFVASLLRMTDAARPGPLPVSEYGASLHKHDQVHR